MTGKGRVLVPEDDTHKQTLTDVYKIYKTSYSKCYDSEEEMFFCDVVHHLEQNSVSTNSEKDSVIKYQVEDTNLSKALNDVPKWPIHLPQNYGVNVSMSLTCQRETEDSPLHYIGDMGVELVEYVKLRIGYNYLKSNINKTNVDDNKYNKAFCPGLSGGIEDPIVLRMLHMNYINSEDYLKWVLRCRKKDDLKKKDTADESTSVLLKSYKSESAWKLTKETISPMSLHSIKDDVKTNFSFDFTNSQLDDRIPKEEILPPLNADEKQHIIMLTQYEVMDQELPDDIEIFWPGKRDLENDFINFKIALSDNILHQHFIQKYKSGKLERLDDDVKFECKQYFMETCRSYPPSPKQSQKTNNEKIKKKQSDGKSLERLKERFKDYKISQDKTLALFDNILKEKTRLEDLNLCCIISKLKEVHKENQEENGKEGDLIWKDMVIVRKRSKESQGVEEVLNVISGEQSTIEDEPVSKDELDEESDSTIAPEFQSMIYVTKVYPKPGISYREDKCSIEFNSDIATSEEAMKEGCTGFSMRDYKPPLVQQCSFKITPQITDELLPKTSNTELQPSLLSTKNRSETSLKDDDDRMLNRDDYVTFHTDWSNYPYSEMIDIIFHRHHKGFVYITDVFEIKPDTLREIERIFHKTGKYSERECGKNSINSYVCRDPQPLPSCCHHSAQKPGSEGEDFTFAVSPELTVLGEDRLTLRTNKQKKTSLKKETSTRWNPLEDPFVGFPVLEVGDEIKIENLLIERETYDSCLGGDSQSTSDDLDNSSDAMYYSERFKSSEVSSVYFDNHDMDSENLSEEFPIHMNFDDVPRNISENVRSNDDDDNSDIVDFIKNLHFDEEKMAKPTNYEKPNEKPEVKEKGIFIDLLPPEKQPFDEDQIIKLKLNGDDFSVDSDDSLSLKDIEGLLGKHSKCCKHQSKKELSSSSVTNVQAPRLIRVVTGEFYDAIIDKRRRVLQELRTSFPLVYLYLNLKTNFSKINITGKLDTYKNYFQFMNKEYDDILATYNLKTQNQSTVKDHIDHIHVMYEEMFGKNRCFSREMYFLAFRDPFVRHLVIREAFQDIGVNLSFFLLQFIENDRFNLLYSQGKKDTFAHDKVIEEVNNLIKDFRNDEKYKLFILDMVIIHYFETKNFYSIQKLIELDLNWEEVLKCSRSIVIADNTVININFKDSVLQECPGYSYSVYNLIKAFNDQFYENNMFQQFLLPEIHPKYLKDLTYEQINQLIKKDCLKWCNITLKAEVEMDIRIIVKTVWKSEILGNNQCYLSSNLLKNRFPNEMANYFLTFFPNIIHIIPTKENCEVGPSKQNTKDIWQYNREFHFWYNKCEKNNTGITFLTKDTLFQFEKLLTQCLLKSILTYYKYRIHG